MASPLPNLGALSLAPRPAAPTGYFLGRRTAKDEEREGRGRIDHAHEETVKKLLQERRFRDAKNATLRHHWQYYFGRYRNEEVLPTIPEDYKELIEKPVYEDVHQLQLVENTPMRRRAYHAEITFESPEIYEMDVNGQHWWLLQHVTEQYVGIDRKIQQLLFDVGRDAMRYKYGDGGVLGELKKHGYTGNAKFAHELASDDWLILVKPKIFTQSLHVGYSSLRGVSLYWRLADELYDYLAEPKGWAAVAAAKRAYQTLAHEDAPLSRMARLGAKDHAAFEKTSSAPWIVTELNGNERAITPRELFEHMLYRAILLPAGADMSCLQERIVTSRFQQFFGTEAVQYRCKAKMAKGYEEFAPPCKDTWPLWRPNEKEEVAAEQRARDVDPRAFLQPTPD